MLYGLNRPKEKIEGETNNEKRLRSLLLLLLLLPYFSHRTLNRARRVFFCLVFFSPPRRREAQHPLFGNPYPASGPFSLPGVQPVVDSI